MKNLILFIEKNKFLANILRFIYRRTVLKYKHYQQNKIFLQNAPEIMTRIDTIFKELNIPYWLEYGTLLGAVREKNFIKHDLDIDLGLFLKDYSDENLNIFEKYGFKLIRRIIIDDAKYGLEESYAYKGVTIDLFYFSKNKKGFYSHGFRNEYGKSWSKTIKDNGGLIVREIYFPYSGFDEIDFLDRKYPIPKDTHSHLKAFYGDNYMIPNAQWNPYTMATNIHTIDNIIGVYQSYE